MLACNFQAQRCCSRVQQQRLDNGLGVFMLQDRSTPLVATVVGYGVGSSDDPPGQFGCAHMLEHLMFAGSANVAAGEHLGILTGIGGFVNANTTTDQTQYLTVVPSACLETVLFLEADRMRGITADEQEFAKQRAAVFEEKRRTIDNQPFGRSRVAFLSAMYDSLAFQHPVIGSEQDIRAMSLRDVQCMAARYYTPNNAVLVLVGDVDTAKAIGLVRHYFGGISPGEIPVRTAQSEAPRSSRRCIFVEDEFAPFSELHLGFKDFDGYSEPFYSALLLRELLTTGKRARLPARLIYREPLALEVTGVMAERSVSGSLQIAIRVHEEQAVTLALEAVVEEICRVTGLKIPAEEWERARRNAIRRALDPFMSMLGTAVRLALYAGVYNAPDRLTTHLTKLSEVTLNDAASVAAARLSSEKMTVCITTPAKRRAAI